MFSGKFLDVVALIARKSQFPIIAISLTKLLLLKCVSNEYITEQTCSSLFNLTLPAKTYQMMVLEALHSFADESEQP